MNEYICETDHAICGVKWPHGGWIMWNWARVRWDDKSDDERMAIVDERNKLMFATPTPNQTIDGDGFYISYNPTDIAIYGHATTALVIGQMQKFYILEGDHTGAYREMIPQGLDACLDYYKAHKHQWHRFSSKLEA